MMVEPRRHKWVFRSRFRRHSFGWRSQPAIKRVKEAVSEIKQAARKDAVLAAEGSVLFLEKLSPALEHVDSSSGAIGTAVNNAIAVLAGIIASAPADRSLREVWLERLFDAHTADEIPYIEELAEHWGELCVFPDLASAWADRLLDGTRMALSPDPATRRGFFQGTSACLSALFVARRYDEILKLLERDSIWPYQRWAIRALVAQGKNAKAIRYAEGCRGPRASDSNIDRFCEAILLSAGLNDEAYERYGLTANRTGTYLAWFRAVVRKYPNKTAEEILQDLVARMPGEEGKWFATAKYAGLFELAIDLANRSPCAPQTLSRAARDFAQSNSAFAVEAGITALRWLIAGEGYDITATDVLDAYTFTLSAAEHAGCVEQTGTRIRDLLANKRDSDEFATRILIHRLNTP